MNWLHSLMMGFVSGLCEPMPVSAEAHRGLLGHLFGLPEPAPLFLLACHASVLIVVLSVGHLELHRLWRTAKLVKTPDRRRTAHPSLNQAGTIRLLRISALLAVVGRLLSYRLQYISDRLWLLSLPLLLTGLILWLPTNMRTANKDGRHLTPMDGLLLGLAALAACVPGISLVAALLSVASMRGTQKHYALRFAWLLLAVSMLTAVAMDLLMVVRGGLSFGPSQLLSAGIGGAAAALGSWAAVHLIRSRFRPGAGGISGFCFYNWGMALLCLALFLLV